ncbi:Fungal lipase-like domain-containing protein [Hirschfeldia incana]|nr:Fungal lipase-like domain-containing protein [Hirschfeldia incana]
MGGGGKGDDFKHVGPKYLLTYIDWLNSNHRTAVTSCLVQGVYSLQRDKIKKRETQAHLWWESFGFSLTEPLINENDESIYGAVFEFTNYQNIRHSGVPPSYVIAFRGTMLKFKTWFKDLKDGFLSLFNSLNNGSRCNRAIQTIEKYTTDERASVWLAGHSLGAGIALLAGKTMAKRGSPLETYAFNPPHSSFPIEKLIDFGVFKGVFRFTESLFKGAIAVVLSDSLQHDPGLAAWTPYVYVNPSDIVCAEYVGDLKHKNRMADIWLGKIESIGAGISIKSKLLGIEEGEPIQLLLSADITVNMNEPTVAEADNVLKRLWYEFKEAHALAQWWEENSARRANWKTGSIRPS